MEVVVGTVLGLLDEHPDDERQEIGDPRVAHDASDLDGVADTDPAGEQGVADARLGIEQSSELAVEGDLGAGRVARGSQVGSHRAVIIGLVEPAFSEGDQGRVPGGVLTAGQFGCPQLGVELAVGHPDQPLEQRFEHITIITNTCSIHNP